MIQSAPNQTHEIRGVSLSIVSVICFSATALILSYLNARYAVDSWVAAAYRAVIGLIVISAFQSRTGKMDLRRIISNRLLFLRGFVGGATIPVYYLCIMELGPGRAGMLGGSYPLFAAIFAVYLIKESLNRRYFAYITLALFGLVGIFYESAFQAGKPAYDLLALAGAAAAGLCVVMIRHLRHTENTSNIFASQCVFTLIFSIIAAGDRLIIDNFNALALTVLAAITVVGGQLSITESFRHISVAKGSTLQMLTPATTVLCSALLLGEQFTVLELISGGAILYASYRIVVSKR